MAEEEPYSCCSTSFELAIAYVDCGHYDYIVSDIYIYIIYIYIYISLVTVFVTSYYIT